MPPLVFLIATTFLAFGLISKLWLLKHKRETRDLPFITDITHGICPRCGDSNPKALMIAAEPANFWRNFSCGCGFVVKAHFRDTM